MHTASFWPLRTNLSSNNLFSIHFNNRNGHITLHPSTSAISITVSSTNSTEGLNCHGIYMVRDRNVFFNLEGQKCLHFKRSGTYLSFLLDSFKMSDIFMNTEMDD
ncbi:uncharacterized protein DS421_19g666490 [Arachis hypogaea]|uniref:Uncharacterized protein n=1 Tax=Arachis hypogaea TaxID=3818 RepID=A0A6B9VCC0_ARAHY|nr:uncharacterized protein DS421_19g666490 [Arachis hypogaea]